MSTALPLHDWQPQQFRGRVVHGFARGRELGFPTANIDLPDDMELPYGVYAGRVDGHPAAISVGVRPTFDDSDQPLLEAHLLDFTGDLYDHEVLVELLSYRREEQRFAEVGALVAQIRQDVEDVRRLLLTDTVAAAVERLRSGGIAVLQDDRRDVAYMVIAGEHCTDDDVNELARSARGLICLALPSDHCDRLGLQVLRRDESRYAAARGSAAEHDHLPFTRSIEARHGVTTGISAADRALTIAAAAAPDACSDDVVVPGHVFPLRARRGAGPDRAGVAEAAIALVELAGCTSAAVVCAVLDDAGEVARGSELTAILDRLEIPLATTSQVNSPVAESLRAG